MIVEILWPLLCVKLQARQLKARIGDFWMREEMMTVPIYAVLISAVVTGKLAVRKEDAT